MLWSFRIGFLGGWQGRLRIIVRVEKRYKVASPVWLFGGLRCRCRGGKLRSALIYARVKFQGSPGGP